jgi:hypothetical protein
MAAARPNNQELTEAVDWTARNYGRCRQTEAGGKITVDWELAETPPPNDFAVSLMKVVEDKPYEFFTKTVPQFLGGTEIVDAEALEHDRKGVMELRGVLRQYAEVEDARKEKKIHKASKAQDEANAATSSQVSGL